MQRAGGNTFFKKKKLNNKTELRTSGQLEIWLESKKVQQREAG